MIELINVSKYYPTEFGRHYVFRNVSLALPLNKSVGIIGPNGAGKSTFLRLLGGSDTPSEGKIIKTGRISPPMGLTPGIQTALTGTENARFAGRIYGMTRDEINDMIEYVRELADIGKYFDMPVEIYSAGMKQRVSFAITMSLKFDYYLFDEISAGGDKGFRNISKKMVQERIQTSKFIIASHRMDELIDICDAGIVIQDGELTFFEEIKEAIAFYGDLEEIPMSRSERRRRKAENVDTAATEETNEKRIGRKNRRKQNNANRKNPVTAGPEIVEHQENGQIHETLESDGSSEQKSSDAKNTISDLAGWHKARGRQRLNTATRRQARADAGHSGVFNTFNSEGTPVAEQSAPGILHGSETSSSEASGELPIAQGGRLAASRIRDRKASKARRRTPPGDNLTITSHANDQASLEEFTRSTDAEIEDLSDNAGDTALEDVKSAKPKTRNKQHNTGRVTEQFLRRAIFRQGRARLKSALAMRLLFNHLGHKLDNAEDSNSDAFSRIMEAQGNSASEAILARQFLANALGTSNDDSSPQKNRSQDNG